MPKTSQKMPFQHFKYHSVTFCVCVRIGDVERRIEVNQKRWNKMISFQYLFDVEPINCRHWLDADIWFRLDRTGSLSVDSCLPYIPTSNRNQLQLIDISHVVFPCVAVTAVVVVETNLQLFTHSWPIQLGTTDLIPIFIFNSDWYERKEVNGGPLSQNYLIRRTQIHNHIKRM